MENDRFKYLIPVPWVLMVGTVTTMEYNKFIAGCNDNSNNIVQQNSNTLCSIASFTECIIVVTIISLTSAAIIHCAYLTKEKIKNYYNNFEL